MKLKDIKDVLSFAAFRPEQDDSRSPWKKRFPKQRSLLLNIGKGVVSWRATEKNGTLGESGSIEGEFKELVPDLAEEWKSLTDDGWVGVSINNRFVISLETNLSRKKGSAEAVRTNPKIALGAKAEKGKRYAVEHNPESNTSILLAVDEEMIKGVEAALTSTGLKVGRIMCGPFEMLVESVQHVSNARAQFGKTNPGESLGKVVSVVCCEGSVVALTSQDEHWLELRSRSGLYVSEDLAPIVKILTPLLQNAGGSAQMIFMADQPGSGIREVLEQSMPQLRITDVSQPDQLWSIMKEY